MAKISIPRQIGLDGARTHLENFFRDQQGRVDFSKVDYTLMIGFRQGPAMAALSDNERDDILSRLGVTIH